MMADDPHLSDEARRWGPADLQGHRGEPTPRQVELRRAGDALRALITALVATEAPESALAAVADDLQRVAAEWGQHPRRTSYSYSAEAAPGGDVHAFLDDSPMMGRANPLAPPVHLDASPDAGPDGGPAIVGTVRFGPQYEGPPGHVHGGYLAAAFDELLGLAQSLGGRPGMTGTLAVRYRAPTPLHVELRLTAWVTKVEGRKTWCAGTIHAGEVLCAESDALFIAIDFAKVEKLARERDEAGRP